MVGYMNTVRGRTSGPGVSKKVIAHVNGVKDGHIPSLLQLAVEAKKEKSRALSAHRTAANKEKRRIGIAEQQGEALPAQGEEEEE